MPKPIPRDIAIRDELKNAITVTLALNDQLETVVAIKNRQPTEVFHGKVDFSQPPWCAVVAGVILELHAEARRMEQYTRNLQGLELKQRGGSSENTTHALKEILIRSANSDDDLVLSQTRWLNAWLRKARMALGEIESTKRLPRVKGQSAPLCPWCKRDTLRELALAGTIFCVDPDCRDSEGRRPKAQLEYFQGEMVLRWMDGIIGVPT